MGKRVARVQALNEVVSVINHLESPVYHEGAGEQTPEEVAGRYAYDAALEGGCISDDAIEGHIEHIYDAGGSFDWTEAMEEARYIKRALRPISMTLVEYIDEEFRGVQKAFAEAQGVHPSQITQWIRADMRVIDDCLYSFRRELKKA